MMTTSKRVLGCVLPLLVLVHATQHHHHDLHRVKLIHTTDVHGWVMGHRHIAQLDADIADFVSLTSHLKRQANGSPHDSYDFLLMDTGDIIEGTGISDATPMHGTYIYPAIKHLPYTALSPGNHDIGANDVIDYLFNDFGKFWGERYITSNIFYAPTNTTLGGSRVLKIRTPSGLRAVIFGTIFDFHQNGNHSTVQTMESLASSGFFTDALKDLENIDIIFAIGHYAPDQNERTVLYNAIRKVAPTTPLIMLAGHSHLLNYIQLDANGYLIQSDHYFLHIGVIDFVIDSRLKNFTSFEHTFLNTSKSEFFALAKVPEAHFEIHEATLLRAKLNEEFDALKLDTEVGCATVTFDNYLPWNQNDSLYYQVLNVAMPEILFVNETIKNQISIVSVGYLRSSLYEGKVIDDDVLSIMPFDDAFSIFKNLSGADFLSFLDLLGESSPDVAIYEHDERLSNEYHHRLIHKQTWARNLKVKFYDDVSSWAKSLNYENIEADGYYDLVGNSYDATYFNVLLKELFEDKYPEGAFYAGISGRELIYRYVQENFPCTSEFASIA